MQHGLATEVECAGWIAKQDHIKCGQRMNLDRGAYTIFPKLENGVEKELGGMRLGGSSCSWLGRPLPSPAFCRPMSIPLSLGKFLPMRRAASPPSVGGPGRPGTGAEAGARKDGPGGGGIVLSDRAAFLRAAVAASTDTGLLLGARLAN